MHYRVLVIVRPTGHMTRDRIETLVGEVLEPYREQEWDWFQIGGRYTGHFTGYDPAADPANIETCSLCGGTGDRATFRKEPLADQHPTGCNGCLGTGKSVKWPTQWTTHDGDIKPLAELTEKDLEVYAVCADEHGWFGGEEYLPWKPLGEQFREREQPPLDWLTNACPDCLAVIVDCHN